MVRGRVPWGYGCGSKKKLRCGCECGGGYEKKNRFGYCSSCEIKTRCGLQGSCEITRYGYGHGFEGWVARKSMVYTL